MCNLHDGIYDDGAKGTLISTDGTEQYVTFDLGAVRSVNRVDLYPGGKGSACFRCFPESFSVLTSTDGVNWQTMVSEQNFVPDKTVVPVFRFEKIDARFLRVIITGFVKKDGRGIAELGEIAIYCDDGGIPDNIPTLYKEPEDNAGDSVTDGDHALAVDKKIYQKGEPIIVTASGEKTDYLAFYPENYVPEGDYKIVMRSNSGTVLLEVFFTVEG